jgi:hypothetical protein
LPPLFAGLRTNTIQPVPVLSGPEYSTNGGTFVGYESNPKSPPVAVVPAGHLIKALPKPPGAMTVPPDAET